ncbi:hypothetical protein C6401_01475 [Arthrobacter woluwensis]|uniref:hypothetical protein n=1 Tax=Arthrobacter woluwensis TaxID=156980 RepID=UPI000D137B1A|nr:hypothetical protein [Arthrobacter woluwensis]PSS45902.1 hypothetical protein C6401_01475 [Arthrobacter woluwensis]
MEIIARVGLGDGSLAFPHPPTLCLRADGSVLAVVAVQVDGVFGLALVHVTTAGEVASVTLPEGAFGAQPVIVDRGSAGVVVLVDDQTAVVSDSGLANAETVPIAGTEAVSEHGRRLTTGGIARPAADDSWTVILSDPVAFQNARTIATFRIVDGTPIWEGASLLHGSAFPMAGGRTTTAPGGAKAPIVGDVLDVDGTRYAAAQGSDTMSLLKYGSDFFTLAALDDGGHVTRRLYEESGWKKTPGKHGIRARFTTDGTSAILTPVFRSGEWKGRQRLVDLETGALREVPTVRGAAGFALVDLRGELALLASDSEVLLVRGLLGEGSNAA